MDVLQEVHDLEILDIGLGLKLQNWNIMGLDVLKVVRCRSKSQLECFS
jgi:hypothetical protein